MSRPSRATVADVVKARDIATRIPSDTTRAAYADSLRAWADQHGEHVRLPDGTWHNPPHDRR